MNPDVYEMVPIEVGSLVWWSGYGILAAVIMALFWLAPRESEPKMAKWEKTLGWMILANLAWYTLMALWDGVYRADESLPIHISIWCSRKSGRSQLWSFGAHWAESKHF
jgi:hypothetical protein